MPEAQEGSSSQSFSGEGPQQASSMQEESHYKAVPESSLAGDLDDLAEPAGEISDVVADDKQETNEDSTADEEEPTTWQASHSPEERSNQQIEDNDPPPAMQVKSHTYNSSTAISSDDFETAGEAADVVQDATQTGNDVRAANAEEQSLDHDAIQKHADQPKKP